MSTPISSYRALPDPSNFCPSCRRLACRCQPESEYGERYLRAFRRGAEDCRADGYDQRPMTEHVFVSGCRTVLDPETGQMRHIMIPVHFRELSWRRAFRTEAAYRDWFERTYDLDLAGYLDGYDAAGASEGVVPHPSEAPVVRDGDGPVYTASGMRVPADEVRASRIAAEADRWRAFAAERTRMSADALARKALSSCAFAVVRGASSFCVPSKLAGTAEHQRALWSLVDDHVGAWTELSVDDAGDGLCVLAGDDRLGEVQPKHLGWVRPLVPFGLRVYLARVTGHEREGYRLGCNVVFGHVGAALNGLLGALGASGGDGASARTVGVPAGPSTADAVRLAVRPEHDAVRPGADPDDVVLWRSIEGTAHASVAHVRRHSPSGVEWGYGGSGPADLALSVLTAVVGPEAAGRHYQAFKADVVARVPYAGGVLRADDVRAWIAGQQPAGR